MDDQYEQDGDDGRFPDGEELVPYVTGSAICTRAVEGRRVRLWARKSPAASSGDKITLVACDEVEISVQLKTRPPATEPTQWMEAIGVVRNGQLLADELIVFPVDACSNVDATGHKVLTKLLNTVEEPWNLGEDQFTNGHS
ncbi:uncharacterized protein LOC143913643 [Arctopsyche grandis]|uniref:uncharacterized protein LOC143913643 n=1 Tax=Arctopsyche grandis TaxID=121162 RepID=UPI00406D6A62